MVDRVRRRQVPQAGRVATIRDDISELFTRLDESEEFARTRPPRTKYLLLVFGFLRRLLDLHLEFVDDLERELADHAPQAKVKDRLFSVPAE